MTGYGLYLDSATVSFLRRSVHGVGEERSDEDMHAVLVEVVQEVCLLTLVHTEQDTRFTTVDR